MIIIMHLDPRQLAHPAPFILRPHYYFQLGVFQSLRGQLNLRHRKRLGNNLRMYLSWQTWSWYLTATAPSNGIPGLNTRGGFPTNLKYLIHQDFRIIYFIFQQKQFYNTWGWESDWWFWSRTNLERKYEWLHKCWMKFPPFCVLL